MHGEPLVLHGCAPTPLASYLKALGVLRLVSSPTNHVSGAAVDPHARGWWENECFHLRTTVDHDGLRRFFLEEYAPTPIIAPWNGGSGFYPGDNKDGFGPLLETQVADRFAPYSSVAHIASQMVADLGLDERPQGDAKGEFVATLRATLPATALPWIDAVLALAGSDLAYPELLGTGGNDGRLDFTNNFARRLFSAKNPTGLFDAATGRPSTEAAELLDSALFAAAATDLSNNTVGQFAPGASGGPNASTGYASGSVSNLWDFVLTLEGAAAFAGTASRRHERSVGKGRSATTRSGASFPFTVRTVGAGWGGVDDQDENDARAEFWAPLWYRPARYCEIDSLLGEGRAVLNGRAASDGLEFARAAASLGVSRGFREFERYGFLMRAGRTYLAAPIGRRSVELSPGIELAADLDHRGWLDRVRRIGRSDTQPSAARRAVKRLEDALFDLVAPEAAGSEIENALIALGRVSAWLTVSPDGRKIVGAPPPLLRHKWMQRGAAVGSSEFRVAAALATIGLPSRDASTPAPLQPSSRVAPPMAAHFAPVDEARFFYGGRINRRRAWLDGDAPPTMVWGAGGLVPNLIAVLERRLVEVSIRSLNDKPFAAGTFAHLSDVAAFISGDFDDARCAALLAGLVWAEPAWLPRAHESGERVDAPSTPFAYAALKPLFMADCDLLATGAVSEGTKLPVPPGLVARLRAGGDSQDGRATDAAVRIAMARAGASGLPSPFDTARAGTRRAAPGTGRIGVGVRADRLAAALLIPISPKAVTALIERAYPGAQPDDDNPDSDTPPPETTNNGT